MKIQLTDINLCKTALKMLFRDKVRYLVLVGAFVFSTLLMTQQAGIFCGLMSWTAGTVTNLHVPVWVMDPKVEDVNETKPMKDTDAARVRSVAEVEWAYPIHYSFLKAKLQNGDYITTQIVGLDSATLIGHPVEVYQGKLENIRLPNAVLIDDLAVSRYKLKMGDLLEINDHQARVVGVFKAARSFSGAPYFITTFERALQYSPPLRKMVTYILAAPKKGISPERLAEQIQKETGLKALTEHQFYWETIWWYFKNTGIPISLGMTVLLGFIVGVAISAQTFYAFLVDNLKHFATFKAMGLSNRTLVFMLVVQSYTVGFFGYFIGSGLAAAFGWIALSKQEPPFLMPFLLVLFTFIMMILISFCMCVIGWRKVKGIEAAIVFRG